MLFTNHLQSGISQVEVIMTLEKLELNKNAIKQLVARSVGLAILEFKKTNSAKGSFILSDLPGLGTNWDEIYAPFYSLYGNYKVSAQEMGRLLGDVARSMGLESKKESRFGKKDAITRYFF